MCSLTIISQPSQYLTTIIIIQVSLKKLIQFKGNRVFLFYPSLVEDVQRYEEAVTHLYLGGWERE